MLQCYGRFLNYHSSVWAIRHSFLWFCWSEGISWPSLCLRNFEHACYGQSFPKGWAESKDPCSLTRFHFRDVESTLYSILMSLLDFHYILRNQISSSCPSETTYPSQAPPVVQDCALSTSALSHQIRLGAIYCHGTYRHHTYKRSEGANTQGQLEPEDR